MRLYQRNRYATPEGRLAILINDARRRSKAAGLPFALEASHLAIPERCPLLGLPIKLTGHRDSSPSLDRLDPRRGYVPGNVWIISWRANRLKNDATLNELISLALNLAKALHGH